jgi:hypothetical protein
MSATVHLRLHAVAVSAEESTDAPSVTASAERRSRAMLRELKRRPLTRCGLPIEGDVTVYGERDDVPDGADLCLDCMRPEERARVKFERALKAR